MVEVFKRIIQRIHPELAARYHLPILAKVVLASDDVAQGSQSDWFEPQLFVDVQPLNESLEKDKRYPVFTKVPVKQYAIGKGRGVYGLPLVDSIVILKFAYGSPQRPYIDGVLSVGQAIAEVKKDAIVIDNAGKCYSRYLSDGNVEEYAEQDIKQQIDGSIERIASIKQTLKSPSTHIGSDTVNLVEEVESLANAVKALADTLATPGHPAFNVPPNESSAISTHSATAAAIKTTVGGIK